jgi:hypothetical protein
MKLLFFTLIVFPCLSLAQCELDLDDIFFIGRLSNTEREDFALIKGFEYNSIDKIYECSSGNEMFFVDQNDAIEYRLCFTTQNKATYLKWKNFANNDDQIQYKGSIEIEGLEKYIYNCECSIEKLLIPNLEGVGLVFYQMKYNDTWLGVILLSYYFPI